jgi:hypothetical protein
MFWRVVEYQSEREKKDHGKETREDPSAGQQEGFEGRDQTERNQADVQILVGGKPEVSPLHWVCRLRSGIAQDAIKIKSG